MKEITLQILHEYHSQQLDADEKYYHVFILDNNQLYQIPIPKALKEKIPAWSCLTIKDHSDSTE